VHRLFSNCAAISQDCVIAAAWREDRRIAAKDAAKDVYDAGACTHGRTSLIGRAVRRPSIFVECTFAQVNACCGSSLSYVSEPRRTLCFPRLSFAASI
jgi:hypothetical protein